MVVVEVGLNTIIINISSAVELIMQVIVAHHILQTKIKLKNKTKMRPNIYRKKIKEKTLIIIIHQVVSLKAVKVGL